MILSQILRTQIISSQSALVLLLNAGRIRINAREHNTRDYKGDYMTKTCVSCNKRKSLKEFYRAKGYSDGYKNQCKLCMKDIREGTIVKSLTRGPKRRDLVGIRFGKLVVESDVPNVTPRRIICRCDCGNVVEKRSSKVTQGKTSACGCGPKGRRNGETTYDMAGYKTGSLCVMYLDGRRYGKPAWLCQCSCGGTIRLNTAELMNGSKTSCGQCRKGTI